MPALNQDGLDPGKPVDFATLVRVEYERKQAKQQDDEQEKPKRGRTEKATAAN
jgi:hypothetical protein